MPLTIEDRKELDASLERTLLRLLVRSSSISEAFKTAIERGFARAFPKQVKELSDALAATLLPKLEAKINEATVETDGGVAAALAALTERVGQFSMELAVLGVDEAEPVEGGGAGEPGGDPAPASGA